MIAAELIACARRLVGETFTGKVTLTFNFHRGTVGRVLVQREEVLDITGMGPAPRQGLSASEDAR